MAKKKLVSILKLHEKFHQACSLYNINPRDKERAYGSFLLKGNRASYPEVEDLEKYSGFNQTFWNPSKRDFKPSPVKKKSIKKVAKKKKIPIKKPPRR